MNPFVCSAGDIGLRSAFEACTLPLQEFGHRAHVRMAYVYLLEVGAEEAAERMRDALLRFLDHHRVDRGKYHETMTRAWMMAVRHFMECAAGAESADAFIDANPDLLDSKIMLTHYSAEVLFSPEARVDFIKPDIDPIPHY